MDKIVLEWLIINIEILGFTAAVLGTLSLIPQVIKTCKSRTVAGISLIMYVIICLDSVLWLIYGIVLTLIPLIIQSSITFTCAFMMILMKLAWNKRNTGEDIYGVGDISSSTSGNVTDDMINEYINKHTGTHKTNSTSNIRLE